MILKTKRARNQSPKPKLRKERVNHHSSREGVEMMAASARRAYKNISNKINSLFSKLEALSR